MPESDIAWPTRHREFRPGPPKPWRGDAGGGVDHPVEVIAAAASCSGDDSHCPARPILILALELNPGNAHRDNDRAYTRHRKQEHPAGKNPTFVVVGFHHFSPSAQNKCRHHAIAQAPGSSPWQPGAPNLHSGIAATSPQNLWGGALCHGSMAKVAPARPHPRHGHCKFMGLDNEPSSAADFGGEWTP